MKSGIFMSSNLIHATAVTTDLLKRKELSNFRRIHYY